MLKNVRVRIKLITAFLVVAVIIGIVGGVGINSLKNVGENAKKMYNQNLRSVYMLTDTKQNLTQMRSDLLDLINGQNEKEASIKAKLEKSIEENKQETDQYLNEIEGLAMNNEEKKYMENLLIS